MNNNQKVILYLVLGALFTFVYKVLKILFNLLPFIAAAFIIKWMFSHFI